MKIGKVIGSVWATRKAQCLQGQTFLIVKSEGDEIVALTSPVCEIVFHSNLAWAERVYRGDGLTEARHPIGRKECFVRAEAVDADGRRAWSQIIAIEQD